ncbi:MAG: phosphoribosyltransferase [Kineosporiaceae bacterium]
MPHPLYRDRSHSGRVLSAHLAGHLAGPDVLVLGLPRGGVPVAAEVARALGAPLDVLVVRKLGVPGQPELAMGALAPGGVRVLNDHVVRTLGIAASVVDTVAAAEAAELRRREHAYRDARPPLDVSGREVVLVDDGLATGASMRAAVSAARLLGAARVVVAVPVGARGACEELSGMADEVVCTTVPEHFRSVGDCYRDFDQTTDEDVTALLRRSG